MCIVCADMSGQFRRTEFIPADVELIDRGLSASQRAAGVPLFATLDVDQRGGTADNGKISLTPTEAGSQLTRSNLSWATGTGQPTTVTYAYRADAPATMPNGTQTFSTFSQAQIAATELMLLAWADVAGITFQREGAGTSGPGAYSNNATMLFGNYASGAEGAAAFAYLPGSRSSNANPGDVWINSSLWYNSTPGYLQYGYQVLLHEIGHAIGLSHPADYNAGDGGPITYNGSAEYFEDSRQYTVMSYFDEDNTGGEFLGGYASAPLLDDIAAAQRLYGANMNTRTGDTVYGFNSTADRIWYSATQNGANQAVIFAVWDAGGVDTLDFSGYTQAGLIDLRQGHFSNVGGLTGNVSIAMGATVENAVGGSGADTLIGNSANNRLTGGNGNDQLDGGAGSDTAVFAGAQSSYTITPGTEIVDGVAYRILTVSGPGGTDVLRNVEFLAFSDGTIAAPTAAAGIIIEGDATADSITGTSFADWIYGADGADTINGGGGADRLNGGRGADILDGGAGIDTADYAGGVAGVTVNLATGTASGGSGADTLSNIENVSGTIYADVLTGDANANVLNGAGGLDTLNGGGGDDTLIAGQGELVGAEDVLKPSSTSNVSRAFAVNIDANFDLMDDRGVLDATETPHAVIRGTGAGGGQEYYAFTVSAGAACTFDIASATFDTTLRIFDSAGNELAANDDDATSTNSLINYTFSTAGTYYIAVGAYGSGSGSTVMSAPVPLNENYVLNVSVPGHAVVPITSVGSTLNGGDGNDSLSGSDASDVFDGGSGTDTAIFAGNRAEWTLTDNGDGSYSLSRGNQTDTLTGIEFAQFADQRISLGAPPVGPTAGDDQLDGTAGDDVIDGLAGNDAIDGLAGNDVLTGGLGSDTLTGGSGSDRFVYNTAAESTNDANRDLITDFTSAQDVLDFSAAGSDRITIQRSGADTLVYFGAAPGGAYEGQVRLSGAAVQGYDLLVGNPDLTLLGDNLANSLTGHVGDDIIQGGGGNDIINGALGADVLTGGEGNDRFDISNVAHSTLGAHDVITDFTTGADRLNLGSLVAAGYTSLTITRVGGSTFVYFALPGSGPAGVVEAIGALNGGDLALAGQTLNLAFTGSVDADIMTGAAGADDMNGGSGDDVLSGAAGDDSLRGGAGADTLDGGIGTDLLNGGDGDDTLLGGAGADFLRGLAGLDTASYAGSNAAVNVNLGAGTASGGHAQGDTFDGVENLTGSSFNDVLTGDLAANRLDGADGDDSINGGSGNDRLFGGAGNDSMRGGSERDFLNGGSGDDVLNGGDHDDVLQGGAGADQLRGLDGIDTANYANSNAAVRVNLLAGSALGGHAAGDVFESIENLVGSAFNDTLAGDGGANQLEGRGGDDLITGGDGADRLLGGGGADLLIGEGGNDTVEGGAGDDVLYGGLGSDILIGGGGNDRLEGGVANDRLTGGSGADTFVFRGASGPDIITDFAAGAAGADVIQLDTAYFTDFADVLAHTTDDGAGNTVIAKGGISITLTGVLKADLSSDDFQFAAAGSPVAAKDETALTLPDMFDFGPQVLPDIGGDRGSDLLGTPMVGEDPLVLPVGFDAKFADLGDNPVVCPPGQEDVALSGDLSAGLGREPDSARWSMSLNIVEQRWFDWIV